LIFSELFAKIYHNGEVFDGKAQKNAFPLRKSVLHPGGAGSKTKSYIHARGFFLERRAVSVAKLEYLAEGDVQRVCDGHECFDGGAAPALDPLKIISAYIAHFSQGLLGESALFAIIGDIKPEFYPKGIVFQLHFDHHI